MRVLRDHILLEIGKGAIVGRGRESDLKGVEIVEHLHPQVVDAAVAFIDDDEIEILNREFGVVLHRRHLFGLPAPLGRVLLLGALVQLLALEDGVEALDGADVDLVVAGNVARFEPVHAVELGEFAVIVVGQIGHELLLRLLAKVSGVDEKEDLAGAGVFEQPVDGGDGGEGLARAGGHLDEGARFVLPEGFLERGDGVELTLAQAIGRQAGQVPE